MVVFFGVWDSCLIVCAVVLHKPATLQQLISHGRKEFISQGLICPSLRYCVSIAGPCLVTQYLTRQLAA